MNPHESSKSVTEKAVPEEAVPAKGVTEKPVTEKAVAAAVFESRFASAESALSTDPSHAFWSEATSVAFDRDHYGRQVSGHDTQVRSRWTKNSLYLLFRCAYRELHLSPNPVTTQETNELWLHDVAEIFLGSEEGDRRCYREFEVSPQGEWIDLDVDLRLVDHEAGWVWQSGIEVAARIDTAHRTWFGAMRIPMASLTQQVPFDGMTFRANLLRSQGPPERRVLLAWCAPMAATFHVPDRFGLLRLTL